MVVIFFFGHTLSRKDFDANLSSFLPIRRKAPSLRE